MLQTFMTKYGAHETVTAENGLAAINAVKQHAEGFDVIFMGNYDISHLLSNTQAIS
jgi:2-keto-3-deoxy-L-rhamnonate aldolase RhmA